MSEEVSGLRGWKWKWARWEDKTKTGKGGVGGTTYPGRLLPRQKSKENTTRQN